MRFKYIVVLTVIFGLIMPTSPASATGRAVEKIPLVGNEFRVAVIDPGEVLPDRGDGILRVRGNKFENRFEGTCGDEPCSFGSVIVANFNVDQEGNGRLWGTFQYLTPYTSSDGVENKWGDREGAFSSAWWGRFENNVSFVRFIGFGDDPDLSGMLVRGSLVADPAEEAAPVEAVIFDFSR